MQTQTQKITPSTQKSASHSMWVLRPMVLATLSVFATLSYAQDSTSSTSTAPSAATTLDAIEVTAQKKSSTPEQVPASVITTRSTASSDTARLLKNIAGVQLNSAGGLSSLPTMQGLSDDRLRVKVDGMDYISACANHMNPALSYLDPTQVGSVKIYAGATPVSVGGDSIGGTIMVNAKAPQFASNAQEDVRSGEIGGFYRSNGNARGGNASATYATDKLSLNYNGSTAQSDNYHSAEGFKAAVVATGTIAGDHVIGAREVGSSAYDTQNHQLAAAFKSDSHVIEAKVGLQNIAKQGFPNQHMDMTGNDAASFNLGYKGGFDWGNLSARVYTERTRHSMNFGDDKLYWYMMGNMPCTPAGPMCVQGMPMDTEGKNTGLSLKSDIAVSDNSTLRVGADYQRYRLNDWWKPSGGMMMWPNNFVNIKDGQRDRYDVFGEWESNLSEQWSTQAGARYSRVHMNAGQVQGYNNGMMYGMEAAAFNALNHKRTDNNIDATLSARYTPSAQVSIEGGISQKTRSPSLYERYTWSTNGMSVAMNNWVNDGNGYKGNINLKPEIAHTLSLSANINDGGSDRWGVRISPYYTQVKDYIDATCLTTCSAGKFNALTLVNQDARLYGADVSGFAQLGTLEGVGSFKAQASIGYAKGKNTTTGDHLYNIMPLNGTLALVHTVGKWSNTIETELVKSKTQVSQTRYENKTAGYGLLNLRSSYEWKNLRVDVGLDNVLNKQYALPLGGAYVGQGRTMSINGAGAPYGIQLPGAGRSFHVGLNVKF